MDIRILLFALVPIGVFIFTVGAAEFKPKPEGVLDSIGRCAINNIWLICLISGILVGIASYFIMNQRITYGYVFILLAIPTMALETLVANYARIQFSRNK